MNYGLYVWSPRPWGANGETDRKVGFMFRRACTGYRLVASVLFRKEVRTHRSAKKPDNSNFAKKRSNMMKKSRIVISIFVALLLMLGLTLSAAADGPVEPSEVIDKLEPGESITVDKTVTTPEIPPKPDIHFMSDTTGSMGGIIAVVSGNATAIMNAISASDATAQFGVGNYRDYPGTVPPYTNQLDITDDTAAVATAISAWAASGGGDGPEGQFYALDRIANAGVGWRDGSTKIVVWFGDAPAHDPVPIAATGLGYNITEATVTADLVAASISVIAISTVTAAGYWYPNALDDNPNNHGGDYAAAYGIVENGAAGQAGRIAAATGGVHLTGVGPDDIVDAIIEGLEAIKTDVWGVVEADDGLTVELDPEVYEDVPSGTSVSFTETITVAEDAEQCTTLTATVKFYANSHPDEGGVIGTQTISIKVKDIVPPTVWCEETVNPHGKNVPGGKAKGKGQGVNPDGFYILYAMDNCDDPEDVEIWVSGFGPFYDGDVVKITEAPGATPSMKKMGSSKGQAGAVVAHLILSSDPVLTGKDSAGNSSVPCTDCRVPPPPK